MASNFTLDAHPPLEMAEQMENVGEKKGDHGLVEYVRLGRWFIYRRPRVRATEERYPAANRAETLQAIADEASG